MVWLGPEIEPVGWLELARSTAEATSSMPMPRLARARGSSCTRTAYFCEPKMLTCDTPLKVASRGEITVSAYSLITDSGKLGELSAMNRIGASDGFTLKNDGGVVMSLGSNRATADKADCTSWAAASMLRSRLNCNVIEVVPSELLDVIDSMPEMVANCFSRGVATEAAMVSGLAPSRLARTTMVGKSIFGSA